MILCRDISVTMVQPAVTIAIYWTAGYDFTETVLMWLGPRWVGPGRPILGSTAPRSGVTSGCTNQSSARRLHCSGRSLLGRLSSTLTGTGASRPSSDLRGWPGACPGRGARGRPRRARAPCRDPIGRRGGNGEHTGGLELVVESSDDATVL